MRLYIVSTPIGNLEDVTLRALRILKEVDLIIAEDTRRTSKLLNHYKISNKMTSYNDFNKRNKTKHIIKLLKQGKELALVSDSGTPGISDPGFHLIRECIKENIKVIPVPGPTAFVSALVCSGLPTDRFLFIGFLDKKESRKKKLFNHIKERDETFVIYESPHRIQKTLKLMAEIIPEKKLVLARELTKKFEEFVRGSVKEVYDKLKEKTIKGELVLVLK